MPLPLCCFFASLCSTAQVSNNALSLERNGRVSLGVLPYDITDTGTTLQLWMNPQHWIPGAIASTNEEKITVTVDKEGKEIAVAAGATGIEEVVSVTQATVIHDLIGRRVETITAPGIYIVNGKKYIRK